MRHVLLTAAAFAALTVQASAHAMLMHASPGAGAMVKPPKEVVLDFSEGLEPALSGVAVTDSAGHDVTAGPPAAKGTEMTVALKPLANGTYRVSWHALSVDTHRTAGSFTFMVMQ
jgi:methionine-rich copper-binding protein CopC